MSTPDEPSAPEEPDLGESLGASTLIGYEQGQWVVYLEVAYASGVRRHRINAYRTQGQARVAADIILRTAMRDHPFRSEGY